MLVANAVACGRRRLVQKQPPWLVNLGPERLESDHATNVYLLTFARVLAERLQRGGLKDVNALTPEEVLACVLGAWGHPLRNPAGGRPMSEEAGPLLLKVVVYQEMHQDGSKHFHVAVLLSGDMSFAACGRTLLERHGLAAHFSRSHTQWWSAVRPTLSTWLT